MEHQSQSPYGNVPAVGINALLISQMTRSVRNEIMLLLSKPQNYPLCCIFPLVKLKFRVPTSSYLSYCWL